MWNTNEDKIRKLAEVVVHNSMNDYLEEEEFDLIRKAIRPSCNHSFEPLDSTSLTQLFIRLVRPKQQQRSSARLMVYEPIELEFIADIEQQALSMLDSSFRQAGNALCEGIKHYSPTHLIAHECGSEGP